MSVPKIYTYTIVRSSTEAFADLIPYCTAILEFEDGHRVSALLEGYADGDAVQVGMKVKNVGTAEDSRYSL